MTDLSTIKEEQITVSKDKLTAIRYKVIEETIDLGALKREKESLQAQLEAKEPDEKELVEMGRMFHPYYTFDRINAENRVLEIKKLLER
jgi:hypothetical protein